MESVADMLLIERGKEREGEGRRGEGEGREGRDKGMRKVLHSGRGGGEAIIVYTVTCSYSSCDSQ